ncbi:MAG: hypothetical protein ACREM6_11615, partial [Vulcanimicrobiaceae bacterium]
MITPLSRFGRIAGFAALVAALAACGGGGGSGAPTIPPSPPPSSGSGTGSFVVQSSATSVPLPSVGGYAESVLLPDTISGSGTTVAVVVSTGAPPVGALSLVRKRQAASTSTPLLYLTLTPQQPVSVRGTIGFVMTLPNGTNSTGKFFYVAQYDGASKTWQTVLGPGVVAGNVVSFGTDLTTVTTLLASVSTDYAIFENGTSQA